MGFFSDLKYNKTNFEAGGLIEELTSRADKPMVKVPTEFIAPRKIDSRDMCLSSSNQLSTPHCAGYSTAGYIEYHNWKTLHYPAQVDGDAIYAQAKKIDGNSTPGTTLKSAIKAAVDLKFINGIGRYVDYPSVNSSNLDRMDKRIISIKFALHQYGVVLAGFQITDEWDYVEKGTGIIRDMGDNAKRRGGHAVLLCGYSSDGVYIQNSWGDWGHYGFATLGWLQYNKQLMQAMIIAPS